MHVLRKHLIWFSFRSSAKAVKIGSRSLYTSRTKVALLEFFKITNPFPIESYMLHVVHVSEILRSDFHTYKPFDIIYLKGCGNLTVLYTKHTPKCDP